MNSVLELVAEIGDVFAEELSRLLVSVGRSIRKVSPMLGVNATTESVSRFNESCLAPNIGLEELWGLHTLELVRPIPAPAG